MSESESQNEFVWQRVQEDIDSATEILKVNGGTLYHKKIYGPDLISTSMCFVPDVDLNRYQAHLRDAYNEGFKDGHEEFQYSRKKSE